MDVGQKIDWISMTFNGDVSPVEALPFLQCDWKEAKPMFGYERCVETGHGVKMLLDETRPPHVILSGKACDSVRDDLGITNIELANMALSASKL